MITKILLENFMAHERTELELGPGVNALTGPNNTGKSAVVEGLRCVATNPVPKHYIRHGAKEARVSLEFEDGTKVVWIRKKRSSGYELWKPGAEEPEEYWKFGRRPPEDILAALRLDLVELETGGEIDVHVGNQREPVFLLNQPGSNAAAFFAASTESAHLLAMQNLLKRKTQDAKRQELDLKGRLGQIESDLDRFAPLPDIAVELEAVRELEATTNRLQKDIPTLENAISAQAALHKTMRHREASATILKEVRDVPKLCDVNELRNTIARINQLETVSRRAGAVTDVLSGMAEVPNVSDTRSLATVCGQLQRLESALRKGVALQSVAAALAEPPTGENTSHLSGIINEMLAVTYRGRREARRNDVLQTLAEPPHIQPNMHLEMLLADLHRVDGRRRGAQQQLLDLENRLEGLKKGITRRVEAIGCCPTCGADLSTEAFLDRRCRHGA